PKPVIIPLGLESLHSAGFTALEREECPLPRLHSDEDTTTRLGMVDRPARRDVQVVAPLPKDLDDLRLGRLAHFEQRDGVAFPPGGQGRNQSPGTDPARPREDLMADDLKEVPLFGL